MTVHPKTVFQVTDYAQGVLRIARSRLYVNASFLLGGMIVSSGFGFVFWAVAARLATPADVGMAAAAVASVGLLTSLSDMGLGTAVVFFGASQAKPPSGLVNAVTAAGWIVSSFAVMIFFLGLPMWAPGLVSIQADIYLAGAFLALAVANSHLALQDAAMLSRRQAHFVFWRNLACNCPPVVLLLPLVLVTGPERALLLAYGLPKVMVSLATGALVLPRFFPGYRFFGKLDRATLAGILPYGLATHSANLLWSITSFAPPLVAISTLPPERVGYFYISWTLMNFILMIPRAVTSSLFVEGAHPQERMRWLVTRSLVLIAVIALPLVAGLWFCGHWILSIFGKDYVNMTLLRLLLLSVIPFAVNSVFIMTRRVQKRLFEVVVFSTIVATGTVILPSRLSLLLGLDGMGWGWFLAQGLPALGVIAIVVRGSLVTRLTRRSA